MNHLEEIKNLQSKIDKSLFSWKKRKLQKKRTLLIREYLEKNDKRFQTLANRQLQLLKTTVKLKATQSRNVMFGSHGTSYKGKVHNNGYAYLNVNSHNFITVNPFHGLKFPRAFKGQVDYLGQITLNASLFDYRLFKTLPEEFECEINEDGIISVSTLSTSAELSQGMITRIIGCLISDGNALKEFRANRAKLQAMIEEIQ